MSRFKEITPQSTPVVCSELFLSEGDLICKVHCICIEINISACGGLSLSRVMICLSASCPVSAKIHATSNLHKNREKSKHASTTNAFFSTSVSHFHLDRSSRGQNIPHMWQLMSDAMIQTEHQQAGSK